MNPFKEATPEQLQRILRIIEWDEQRSQEEGESRLDMNFMTNWVNGKKISPERTTDEFIRYWEDFREDYQ